MILKLSLKFYVSLEFGVITTELNLILVKKKLLVILSTYICPLSIVPPEDTIICKGDNGVLRYMKREMNSLIAFFHDF